MKCYIMILKILTMAKIIEKEENDAWPEGNESLQKINNKFTF